jgi:TonB family protein
MQRAIRIFCACLSLMAMALVTTAQTSLTAKANNLQPATAGGPNTESDRARDGLAGPVRRVRTEVVRLSSVSGKSVEEPKRVLLETAEYDVKGVKTQNQYFPISGATLTGREVYKYDDKGNISEMTLLNANGSLLSKEIYKYEFDTIGNWIKMTASVAVVENGKIEFEPTEVTYRTIFYYLDASMAKMLQPATNLAPVVGPAADNAKPANPPFGNEPRIVASLPIRTSSAKLNGSPIQPLNLDLRPLTDASKKDVVMSDSEPPAPRPLLKPVSGGVLNGKALSLPAPSYPEVARRTHTAGTVEVEVIVDENGKVVSARAISGPAALRDVAVEAALRARFSPTKLSGQAVKIAGRIDYKFTLP